ncbi:MAG: RNA 2',3'-cyclic phosphodiesterase [Acidobacteria bacterium]|nr:RNA 2',3'-cyclic phosphodiesterase [Acidobacteriota bacterium]
MRTFIAIDIPEKIRASIGELMATLKPAATNIRWSRPEGLHITLKFLGELQPARIEQVKQSLSQIHLAASFQVAIQGAGFFPNERSPRVMWLGIAAGAELAELASRVEESLMPLGFEKENRPYSPHLTMGRINPPGKIFTVQELLRRREPLAFGSFTATEFFLYESKPSRNGSVYNKIAGFGIAPRT